MVRHVSARAVRHLSAGGTYNLPLICRVAAETITKTDNVPKSAETGDIGDVVGDVDNRSAVAVDKTQPVFVKSFHQSNQHIYMHCSLLQDSPDSFDHLILMRETW